MDYYSPDSNLFDYQIAELSGKFESERQACRALELAIECHCRGQYVPEEIARWCRLHAVNLDRNLARAKNEPLPKMDKHHKDFSEHD